MPTKKTVKTAKTPKAKAAPRAKAATKKPAASAKRAAAAPAKKPGPRADFGKPIDSFFDKQPPRLREILLALRSMVDAAAPDADTSIKWGMPFFQIRGNMFVALGAHKAHVNLILAGAPEIFDDPDGLLIGDGKTGRHLKLRTLSELPASRVRGWLKTAATIARAK